MRNCELVLHSFSSYLYCLLTLIRCCCFEWPNVAVIEKLTIINIFTISFFAFVILIIQTQLSSFICAFVLFCCAMHFLQNNEMFIIVLLLNSKLLIVLIANIR